MPFCFRWPWLSLCVDAKPWIERKSSVKQAVQKRAFAERCLGFAFFFCCFLALVFTGHVRACFCYSSTFRRFLCPPDIYFNVSPRLLLRYAFHFSGGKAVIDSSLRTPNVTKWFCIYHWMPESKPAVYWNVILNTFNSSHLHLRFGTFFRIFLNWSTGLYVVVKLRGHYQSLSLTQYKF